MSLLPPAPTLPGKGGAYASFVVGQSRCRQNAWLVLFSSWLLTPEFGMGFETHMLTEKKICKFFPLLRLSTNFPAIEGSTLL
jgi:hypothetical protein